LITQKTKTRKILVVLFALVIALLANWVRVVLIGLWAYFGGEIVHGPLHIFQASFTLVLGNILVLVWTWMLSVIPHRVDTITVPKEQIEYTEESTHWAAFNRAWFLAVILLLCAGFFYHFRTATPVPLKNTLADFPGKVGTWQVLQGKAAEEPDFTVPGADVELYKRYRNPAGREMKLYVGYFETQTQAKELINYKLRHL
jgi:exosortase/archaeosortase family protein